MTQENPERARLYKSTIPSSDEDWSILFQTVGQQLYRYCLKIIGNSFDAEDCVAETFYRFFNRINNFDYSRPIQPYLFRIARNVALDMLRAKQKHLPLDEAVKFHPNNFADYAAEDSKSIKATIEWLVAEADLSPTQASILTLFATYNDLKTSDVAIMLDLTPKQVSQSLWRARKKIQDMRNYDDIVNG